MRAFLGFRNEGTFNVRTENMCARRGSTTAGTEGREDLIVDGEGEELS